MPPYGCRWNNPLNAAAAEGLSRRTAVPARRARIAARDAGQAGGSKTMTLLKGFVVCGFALVVAAVLTASALRAQKGVTGGEWGSYAGDNGSSRYAPYDLITRDNGKDLQVAWSWKFDDFGG